MTKRTDNARVGLDISNEVLRLHMGRIYKDKMLVVSLDPLSP